MSIFIGFFFFLNWYFFRSLWVPDMHVAGFILIYREGATMACLALLCWGEEAGLWCFLSSAWPALISVSELGNQTQSLGSNLLGLKAPPSSIAQQQVQKSSCKRGASTCGRVPWVLVTLPGHSWSCPEITVCIPDWYKCECRDLEWLLEPWALCPSRAKCWHTVKDILSFAHLMPRGKAGANTPGRVWAGRGAWAELAYPNSCCHTTLLPLWTSLLLPRQFYTQQIHRRDGFSGRCCPQLWLWPVLDLSTGPHPKESAASPALWKAEEYCLLFAKKFLSDPKLPWEAPGSFWVKNNQTPQNCRLALATHMHPVQGPSGSFVEPLRGIRLEGLALLLQKKKKKKSVLQTPKPVIKSVITRMVFKWMLVQFMWDYELFPKMHMYQHRGLQRSLRQNEEAAASRKVWGGWSGSLFLFLCCLCVHGIGYFLWAPRCSVCVGLCLGDWLVNLTGFLLSLFSFKHWHHISLPSLGCN